MMRRLATNQTHPLFLWNAIFFMFPLVYVKMNQFLLYGSNEISIFQKGPLVILSKRQNQNLFDDLIGFPLSQIVGSYNRS